MECLSCGGEMEVRELHPLYESGGMTFRCEAAVLHYACDTCRVVSSAPIDAPAPAAAAVIDLVQGPDGAFAEPASAASAEFPAPSAPQG